MNGATPSVTILVTGFAPFIDGESMNPSSVIASLLPTRLLPNPSSSIDIDIVYYPYPIRVAYDEVRSLVPNLYNAYGRNIDMVLHLGVAPNRTYYAIERQAHRDGYDQNRDVLGKTLEKGEGERYWRGLPPVLESSLDIDDVCDRWRSKLLSTPEVSPEIDGVVVKVSEDPGHYLCDFIYYSMLAEYRKHASGVRYAVDEQPVVFFHVPGGTGSQDIRHGKLVATALIRALAESYLQSKHG